MQFFKDYSIVICRFAIIAIALLLFWWSDNSVIIIPSLILLLISYLFKNPYALWTAFVLNSCFIFWMIADMLSAGSSPMDSLKALTGFYVWILSVLMIPLGLLIGFLIRLWLRDSK